AHPTSLPTAGAPAEKALRDPVCGMTVTRASPHRATHAGEEYFFCSAGCLQTFLKDASRNRMKEGAGAEAGAPAHDPAHGVHTCPMHPQVRRWGPGSCPKCGMALEAAEVTEPAA